MRSTRLSGLLRGAAAVAMVAAAGCLGLPSEFHCDKDSQCVLQQQQGTCEGTGYCSFPEPSCQSGRKYSEYASSALASSCVDASIVAGDAGGDAGYDAGWVDAGPTDAGYDAGYTDAGPTDAGEGDAGYDAGYDAGPEDAGPPDAGPPDAGPCGALNERCCDLADAGTSCDTVLLTCGAGTCQPAACYDSVSSHGDHTCAHRIDDTVWCWGDNSFGELGDGTSNRRTSPVQVLQSANGAPLTGIEHAFDGSGYSCAHVRATNEVKCWGNNNLGQLGNADPNNAVSFSPVSVLDGPGGAAFQGIKRHRAGGDHTCAIKQDNSVWCWGAAASGQLGHGDRGISGSYDNYPVMVYIKPPNPGGGIAFSDAAAIAAGAKHSCARTTDGGAWCWGDNSLDQLGAVLDAGWDSLVPVRVANLPAVDLIEAGANHTCAHEAFDGGAVWCWGAGSKGQLGSGDAGSLVPLEVPNLNGAVTQLALGANFSCARMTDGTVWCWGENREGELGNDSSVDSVNPVQVVLFGDGGLLFDAVSLAAGNDHTCVARADGTVWCWGSNASNQLGAGNLYPDAGLIPVKVNLPCGN